MTRRFLNNPSWPLLIVNGPHAGQYVACDSNGLAMRWEPTKPAQQRVADPPQSIIVRYTRELLSVPFGPEDWDAVYVWRLAPADATSWLRSAAMAMGMEGKACDEFAKFIKDNT